MSREGPHVLFCAFAEVPGPSAAGVRTAQMMRAFGDGFDVDGLCLKGVEVAHIERLGSARVMRVPVENKPFLERLAAYRRALGRQLAGDSYDVVWCADLFSGAVCASYKEAQGFSLLVDVNDLPSESFARLYEVDPTDTKLRAEWVASEKAALRSATVVVASSRTAAKALSGRVDPRRVHVLPRAVDREVFAPPSIELALDGKRTVLVLGGRDGGPLLEPALDLLVALTDTVRKDEVQVALAGTPPEDDAKVRAAIAARGLANDVKVIDTETSSALASALADAHIVVVPSLAEAEVEPHAPPHRALEAMACRRPTVITGPESAFTDMLVPGEDALVTPARDPVAAAAAVQKLMAAPALRESIAQSGARRIEQEADLKTRLGQFAALLSDVLGVALAPHAESTDPADAFEPSSAGTAPVPPSTDLPAAEPNRAITSGALPRPPVEDPTDSGRHHVSQVVVRAGPRAPAQKLPTVADPLLPVPTESHPFDVPGSESVSSVFTDEGAPQHPSPAPPAPSAVDLAASSLESSLVDAQHIEPLPGDKTIIAPPPEGLEELQLPTPGEDSGGDDDWYGDTRIDSSARYPLEPTPASERARATTRRRVELSSTSGAPSARAFAAEPERSLPEGDPWSHDTIADARPVFTSDDTARKATGQERTPPPIESSGRNFLVDPELLEGRRPGPLDEATVDDMHLPRETPSSEGEASDG